MANTTRLAIPYPALDGSNIDDVPDWMNQMAVRLDAIIAPVSHGPLGSRPVSSGGSPGIADRIYVATDVNPATIPDAAGGAMVVYRDTGTGWVAIGPFASKFHLGTFLGPGTNGDVDYTGLGFQPKYVEFDFHDMNATTLQSQSGTGGMDGSIMWSMYSRSRESSGDSVGEYTNGFAIRVLDLASAIKWKAIFGAFLADGFRLTWQDTSGGAGNLRVVYKAWG